MAIISMQPPEKSSPDLESVTIPGFFIAQNILLGFQRQRQNRKTGSRLTAAPRSIFRFCFLTVFYVIAGKNSVAEIVVTAKGSTVN